jgi:hypothetical protein
MLATSFVYTSKMNSNREEVNENKATIASIKADDKSWLNIEVTHNNHKNEIKGIEHMRIVSRRSVLTEG